MEIINSLRTITIQETGQQLTAKRVTLPPVSFLLELFIEAARPVAMLKFSKLNVSHKGMSGFSKIKITITQEFKAINNGLWLSVDFSWFKDQPCLRVEGFINHSDLCFSRRC